MENPVISSTSTISFAPSISFAKVPCVAPLARLQAEVESLLHNSRIAGAWIDHVNKKEYAGGWDVCHYAANASI